MDITEAVGSGQSSSHAFSPQLTFDRVATSGTYRELDSDVELLAPRKYWFQGWGKGWTTKAVAGELPASVMILALSFHPIMPEDLPSAYANPSSFQSCLDTAMLENPMARPQPFCDHTLFGFLDRPDNDQTLRAPRESNEMEILCTSRPQLEVTSSFYSSD